MGYVSSAHAHSLAHKCAWPTPEAVRVPVSIHLVSQGPLGCLLLCTGTAAICFFSPSAILQFSDVLAHVAVLEI